MKPFRIALTLAILAPLAAWSSEPVLERELARLAEMSGGTMGIDRDSPQAVVEAIELDPAPSEPDRGL